mmetsp:Transcript_36908/g.83544  ORF Transcript_36908/g.83544 Transcript_36908/m.83544 type:complete len:206 (+) Transcript_36908:727-1344(+)
MRSAGPGRSTVPSGSSNTNDPMNEWPENRAICGLWFWIAARASARVAAGSMKTYGEGTARSNDLSSRPNCSGPNLERGSGKSAGIALKEGLEKRDRSSMRRPERSCRWSHTSADRTNESTKVRRSKRLVLRTASSMTISATTEKMRQSSSTYEWLACSPIRPSVLLRSQLHVWLSTCNPASGSSIDVEWIFHVQWPWPESYHHAL